MADGSVYVKWLESSNEDAAYITYENTIASFKIGTTTLTGIVVPATEDVVFDSAGNAQYTNHQALTQTDDVITVTAMVNVEGNRATAVGRPDAAISHSISFDSRGGSAINTIWQVANGTVSNLPTPTRDGYTFDGWFTDAELTKPFNTDTTFTSNLKLYAKWTPNVVDTTWKNPYKDMAEGDWFYEAVKYVSEHGFFKGTEDDMFTPNGSLTRAMLVTVLYRAAGKPMPKVASTFKDVPTDAYYNDAVAWAEENEIVMGVYKNEFAPEQNITREQLASIMYRYCKMQGDVKDANIKLAYKDTAAISDWAIYAVFFCTDKGLMQGNEENEFLPQSDTTRAETATILGRLFQ